MAVCIVLAVLSLDIPCAMAADILTLSYKLCEKRHRLKEWCLFCSHSCAEN